MMLDYKDLDYFNYGKIENEKFWRRLGGEPNLEKKNYFRIWVRLWLIVC